MSTSAAVTNEAVHRFIAERLENGDMELASELFYQLEDMQVLEIRKEFEKTLAEMEYSADEVDDDWVEFLASHLNEDEDPYLIMKSLEELAKLPLNLRQYRKFDLRALLHRYEGKHVEDLVDRFHDLEYEEEEVIEFCDAELEELVDLEEERSETPTPTTDELEVLRAASESQLNARDRMEQRRSNARRRLCFV